MVGPTVSKVSGSHTVALHTRSVVAVGGCASYSKNGVHSWSLSHILLEVGVGAEVWYVPLSQSEMGEHTLSVTLHGELSN